MKPQTVAFILAVIAALTHPLRAAHADSHEAPHFEIAGAQPGHDVFPLKSTQVQVHVSGVIADVELTQTYANTGTESLDALYVFPGSTRAAVHGMEIKIGNRVITATIQEKGQAKQIFEKAKTEKKAASLLEQHRPNVFQMSVANISAGAEVQVRLHYSEMLAPTERVYEFILPGAVGPRYSTGSTGETWQGNPFLAEGAKNPAKLDFAMHIDAGLPIKSLASPSHDMSIRFLSATAADLDLKPTNDDPNKNDLIVRYQLADKKVTTGLLLHQGQDENFFMLNVQPPERITSDEVPARDYLFVVDVSGSMHGFPLDTTKQLMNDLFSKLRPKDKFNLLLFSGGSSVLSEEALPVTATNIRSAMNMMRAANGGGGTELLPALKHALTMPSDEARARSIVVVTDGYIDVETQAFDFIRRNLNQASLFAIGVGTSVNRHLIEGLAHVGNGEPFVITHPGEINEVAKRFVSYVTSPVLTDIHVRAEGFDIDELEPASVPILYADRPLKIIGKWKGAPQGKLIVTGRSAHGPYEASFDVASVFNRNNPALRPLWARERARVLGDYAEQNDNAAKHALTTLGLKYSLLTGNTSFVAADTEPQTILASANLASPPTISPTSTSPGSTPEPGTTNLMILSLAALLFQRRRIGVPPVSRSGASSLLS